MSGRSRAERSGTSGEQAREIGWRLAESMRMTEGKSLLMKSRRGEGKEEKVCMQGDRGMRGAWGRRTEGGREREIWGMEIGKKGDWIESGRRGSNHNGMPGGGLCTPRVLSWLILSQASLFPSIPSFTLCAQSGTTERQRQSSLLPEFLYSAHPMLSHSGSRTIPCP
eukprot:1978349-Rhodomonas_salina.1